MIELVFWASVFLILYHYIGYPIAVRLIAGLLERRPPAVVTKPVNLPSVTIIVPAHNEEAVIEAKIRNLAELKYPRCRLAVVLALDGCTDSTAEIAWRLKREVGDLDIQILEYASNIGKVSVLNDRIAKVTSEIVALSDASALLDPHALLQAVRHFERHEVGVVCPTYQLSRPGSEGERGYWKYQTGLKAAEGAVGAPMGAHGAFYLFRRSLWEPLQADTINDDFVLPMTIVRRGYNSVYDPSIIATELEMSTVRQDFRRRIRIGAGNLQQVLRMAALADMRRPGIAFVFLSGKALRAFAPFLVLVVVAAVPILALQRAFYSYVLIGGVAAALAIFICQFAGPRRLPRLILWATYFAQGHAANLIGALILLCGSPRQVWKISTEAKNKD